MKQFRTALLLAAFALFASAVAPSHAEALSPVEISCRDGLAKGEAKYTKLALKTVQRCHLERSTGKRSLGDDCNDLAQADSRGKLARARTKLGSKMSSGCNGAESLLPAYTACPDPSSTVDDGGATTGIDDFDEVAQCVLALAGEHAGGVTLDAMGIPDERLLQALAACQAALGRGASALVQAHLAEGRSCERSSDAAGGESGYSCDGSDSKGRIARARGTLGEMVFDACDFIPSSELAKLLACSDTSDGLAECARASADLHGDAMIRNAYELLGTTTTTTTLPTACGSTFPQCNGSCGSGATCQDTGGQCACVVASGPCAPATIYRHVNAKYGTPAGNTQLSTGWTGKTHQVDLPDDSFDALDVTCDGECRNCDVKLNKRVDDPTTNCRCAGAPQTSCTVIAGPDPDHCGSLNPNCACYFGPGLAISSGGTPVCVLNQLREDYSGTMDMRTGDYSDRIKLASLVYLGISQFSPCPTCDGDVTAGDGVRDGTCNGGSQNGQTCDVNGIHHTFGSTSFDCPPSTVSNISGSGLQISLNLESGQQQLAATLPCDSPSGALCPCRVCSGNSQMGCSSDAECAAASAGTCTAGGDVGIQPNSCSDGLCSASGLCEAGPVDMFCDGITHADGSGFVTCTTDVDCSVVGAGACTVAQLRRCFPDPITVSGVADVYNPVTGAIFCIPPTTNIAVNQTGGIPGPGTIQLDFDVDVRCQSDPSRVYQFPDGANCPNLVTTTTTTTTTITLPLPPCGSATYPVCGGLCPVGQVCIPTLVSTCACTGV